MAKAPEKKTWKTAQFGLPVQNFSDWRPLTSVRICGDEIQVQVSRHVSKPFYDSAADYAREILEAAEGLIDDRMEYVEGDDHNASEITMKGWRLPTEAELAIIKEGREDAQWRPLMW